MGHAQATRSHRRGNPCGSPETRRYPIDRHQVRDERTLYPIPYLAQVIPERRSQTGHTRLVAIFQYSFQKKCTRPNTQILLVILVTLSTSLQGPSSSSENTHFDDQMDTLEAQTGHTQPPKQSSNPRGSHTHTRTHTATEPPTAQQNRGPKDSRGCLRAQDPHVRVTYTNTHVPGHTF